MAEPTGVTCAGTPVLSAARSDSGSRASISNWPPRAIRNSAPEPAPTIWPGSTLRVKHQAGGGRADVEAADPGAALAEIGLGDPDPGERGVAGGDPPLDVGLGDEAARHQRLRPVQLLLGEAGIGAGDVDLGGELRGFLSLDRAVDDGERLAGADPLAGLDEDADDLAALARDPDRHVVAGGELAGGGDGAGDLLAARARRR